MRVSACDAIGVHHFLEQRFVAFNSAKPPHCADNLNQWGTRWPRLAEQSRAEQCLGADVGEILLGSDRAAEAGEVPLQPVESSSLGLSAIRLAKDCSQTSGKVGQQ